MSHGKHRDEPILAWIRLMGLTIQGVLNFRIVFILYLSKIMDLILHVIFPAATGLYFVLLLFLIFIHIIFYFLIFFNYFSFKWGFIEVKEVNVNKKREKKWWKETVSPLRIIEVWKERFFSWFLVKVFIWFGMLNAHCSEGPAYRRIRTARESCFEMRWSSR